jgi:rare lipoprotein A (peptidoglycan hydrolase)
LSFLLVSTASQAHGVNLPLTQGQTFEFIERDDNGYHFHKPRFIDNFNRNSQVVEASYYGSGEKLNRYTSSGQVFNPRAMTCAHRSLPLGTKLSVEYHGRRVVVTVNDRGPARWTGRALDLSYGAARALGMTKVGVAKVRVAVL